MLRSRCAAALVLALGSLGATARLQEAAKVVPGTARGGLAIRVIWLEREDAALPARVTSFSFPVACDYDSQEVRSVTPLRGGAELVEDEDGNVTMVYDEPIEIGADAPLCLGSVNDVVLYSQARLKVRPLYVRGAPVPDEVRARFTADDAILTLTDPDLAQLAARLKAESDGELDLALRTWSAVYTRLEYGRVERPNTAAQVLEWRRGQCGEYGKLTIALLRANGIPARGVWCLRAGNTGPSADDHAWAEAWIGNIGWFPIRPQEEPPESDEYALGYHSYQVVCRPPCGLDELRVVAWENAACPTGHRGVGFFADVPEGQRGATVAVFRDIADDVAGGSARRHLARAGRAHRAAQPMLYWLLAASPDARVGQDAAEALVEVCGQTDRRLGLERFVDASPRLVRERIAAASGR